MTGIKEQVKAYLVDNLMMGLGGEPLADDASFLDRGIIDSTGVIELISYLESTFGIRVEDEEMVPENLDSLIAIERFVSDKLSATAAPAVIGDDLGKQAYTAA